VAVRKELFSRGYWFRKNDKLYLGKPDIVLTKYRTVIFVHGCFWHRHMGCKNATTPKTRTEWWSEKLKKNVINDVCNQQTLEE
jgi:DNA mismatch endonuclease Vsr